MNRIATAVLPLRRWQLIVFRDPERADRQCVKRIVALPGESVQILAGDVYVNGHIARKTLAEQRAMAQPVQRTVAHAVEHEPAAWQPATSRTGWRRQGSRLHWHRSGHPRPIERQIDWLEYRHAEGETVTDDTSYNPTVSRRLGRVDDLMLSLVVEAQGSGTLWLWARGPVETYRARIVRQSGSVQLLRNGSLVAESSVPIDWQRRSVRIDWSLFDAQLLLAVDGRTVCRYRLDDAPRPADARRPAEVAERLDRSDHRPGPLAIGSAGLDVTVHRIMVQRDVYFTCPPAGRWGIDPPYQLGPSEVFVLGDNSPISVDSRNWHHAGGLPVRLIVGEALGAWGWGRRQW